jgi:hypothetical protein
MALNKLGVLGPLPHTRLTGGRAGTTFAPSVYSYVLADEDWSGRPLLSSRRAEVPAAWTPGAAFVLWKEIYGEDMEAWAADRDVVFSDPRPRWGERGTPARTPRALVVDTYGGGAGQGEEFESSQPARVAIEGMAAELEAAGVFSFLAYTRIADSRFVRHCLIDEDIVLHGDTQPGGAQPALVIDESRSAGGEALFLSTAIVVGASAVVPYYDLASDTPLDETLAWDLDVLQRCVPRFSRVKYECVLGNSSLLTAGAEAALDDFVAGAPAGSVALRKFAGNIGGADLAAATAHYEAVIRDFFDL